MRTRRGSYCVYMVRCSDGTYYTGATNNLDARIKRHNDGQGAKYLRGKGPVRVVYAKRYRYYKRALQAEARLKRLTRGEKEMLVQRCRTTPHENYSPMVGIQRGHRPFKEGLRKDR